ncbi:GTP cyclohydrolase II [Paracoccus sp. JM45]|uniref:GTP cyclohydrolase II n=1 Tax=Paracoccus sp. JM45 TaxID=2283626 RepID=UPI0021035664|nr:GTP cyclohydrolase II [Paracoccus sp. JM45]
MVSDLRLGLPVVLTDSEGAAMILPVETLSQDRYHALEGAAELVMTSRRAAALGQHPSEGDVTLMPVPAAARLDWLKALADPSRQIPVASAMPLSSDQTPADLHHAAIRLVKKAELVPAALVVRGPNVMETAIRHNLGVLHASQALEQTGAPRDPQPVSNARVPMFAAHAGRLHVFRNNDGGAEHYAIQVGDPDPSQPVLVRLHSACFTGDVLGSLKCDCGPQLRAALAAMNDAGSGVLLYLNQEGRGIGLANKMRAYSLQDQGLDTVEANHTLGFEDDERDFRTGAALLRQMGIGQVRLMTNNPAKIARLDSEGIKVVERVALHVGRGPENTRYLDTKASKSGHMM